MSTFLPSSKSWKPGDCSTEVAFCNPIPATVPRPIPVPRTPIPLATDAASAAIDKPPVIAVLIAGKAAIKPPTIPSMTGAIAIKAAPISLAVLSITPEA